jgi:predicted MFS family arabinose efflux permease
MVSAANQMLWLTFTPFTTDAAQHYGVSVGAIGWLAEIFPLVYVVLAVPTGRIIDRNLRAGLTAGAGLTAVGALARLAGGSYGAVLTGQVLVAVAQPLVLNAVTKLAAYSLRPVDRPNGIAVSSAGIFGGMVLALLTGTIAGVDHLSALLAAQAAFAVVGAGWLVVALNGLPASRLRAAAYLPETPPSANGLRAVLRDRSVRLLVLLAVGGFGVFVALTTWLQALLKPAGVTESGAGTLLLAMVLAGVVGSGLLPGPLVRNGLERRFLLASVLAGAAAMGWLATGPGFAAALPALVALGVLLLTDLPVILDLLERRAGSSAGMATAALWLGGNLGGLVLALVVQLLVHRPAAAFLVMAAVLLSLLPALRRLP